jgi:hypothetical protein
MRPLPFRSSPICSRSRRQPARPVLTTHIQTAATPAAAAPFWPTNTAIPTYASGGLNNGLNDATFGGLQTAVTSHTYKVIIDGTSSGADTFKWNVDSGSFTTGVSINGRTQALANGIMLTFRNKIGHTLGAQWVITTPVIVNDNQLTGENIGPISAFPSRVSVSHNIIENSCMGLFVHGVRAISLDSNQINGSLCTTPTNISSVIFSDVYGDIDFYHNKIRNGQGCGVLADNIQVGDSQLARFCLKDNEFESNGSAIPGLFNDVRLSGFIAGPQLASLQGDTFLGPYITQSILVNDATTTNLINNTIPAGNTVAVGVGRAQRGRTRATRLMEAPRAEWSALTPRPVEVPISPAPSPAPPTAY